MNKKQATLLSFYSRKVTESELYENHANKSESYGESKEDKLSNIYTNPKLDSSYSECLLGDDKNANFDRIKKSCVDTRPGEVQASKSQVPEKLIVTDCKQYDLPHNYKSIPEISSYEKLRLDNIKRNSDFLAQLGLESIFSDLKQSETTSNKIKKRTRNEQTEKERNTFERVLRRSTRVAKLNNSTSDLPEFPSKELDVSEIKIDHSNEKDAETPRSYDDSSVFRYCISSRRSPPPSGFISNIMSHSNIDSDFDVDSKGLTATTTFSSSNESNLQKISLKYMNDAPVSSANLTAIYAMQHHPVYPGLLLAAGKAGNVTIFNINFNTDRGSDEGLQSPPSSTSTATAPMSSHSTDSGNSVLMSFQAHSRWVSAAKFLPFNNHSIHEMGIGTSLISTDDDLGVGHQGEQGEKRESGMMIPVITSSDDGSVKIWDIGKSESELKLESNLPQSHNNNSNLNSTSNSASSTGARGTIDSLRNSQAKLLYTNRSLHSKGIFSLDVQYASRNVLTGSKDHSICLSTLDTDDFSLHFCHRYTYHSGVVKTVSWQGNRDIPEKGNSSGYISEPSYLFGSGGIDRNVYITDIRSSSSSGYEFCLEEVNKGCINSIVWCPFISYEHYFLTSGLDDAIRIYDMRCLTSLRFESKDVKPLHEYRGHTGLCKKFTTIFTPRFLTSSVIIVCGENSEYLSLYDINSGETISRGGMPDQPMVITPKFRNYRGGSCDVESLSVACRRGASIYSLKLT